MRVPAFAFALGLGLSSLAASAFMAAATPREAAAAREQDVPPAVPKSDCLACHSYDDVIAETADYVTRSAKVNPHRYVEAGSAKENFGQPHQATGTEHIPECSNCHAPHPIPPTGAVDRSKINVEWCYTSCHHENEFTRCGACHN